MQLKRMCDHSPPDRPIQLIMLRFVVAWLFAMSWGVVRAQSGDPSTVFSAREIPIIHVRLPADSLAWLLHPDNLDNERELRASVRIEVDGQVHERDPVGFRLRGNTSRRAAKKSYKLSFNTFESGATLFGLEKMNLNGEHNDPSLIRTSLAWDLAGRFGIPASRSRHVLVHVNDAFHGVYLLVEHVDENFVADRFGNAAGNLYKCLYPADLAYKGPDADSYSEPIYGRPAYELNGAVRDTTYRDLISFIRFLHDASDGEFVEEIRDRLDLDGFLRAMAFETLIGHWDNYWFNQNNYYLYHDPLTGRFHYIPYDLDNTFGIWWDGAGGERNVDWAERDVYEWGSGRERRILVERVLGIQEFRDRYSFYLQYFIDIAFSPQHLNAALSRLSETIASHVEKDPYYAALGYTLDDFYGGLNDPMGGHVTEAVLPYIRRRGASATAQASWENFPPVFLSVVQTLEESQEGGALRIEARVLDANRFAVSAYRGADNGEIAPLMDNGVGADRIAGDGVYSARVPLVGPGADARFYLLATDLNSYSTRHPYRNNRYLVAKADAGAEAVRVNEFMADNAATIADESGAYEDWIELYNASDGPVSLAGFHLSDDASEPLKWALPDTVVPAGGFYLVWADDDPEQGANHATFKLSKSGEQVVLSKYESERVAEVDRIDFGEQREDVTYGRLTDGGEEVGFLPTPTPGMSNQSATSVQESGSGGESPFGIRLLGNYPNPFNGETVIRFQTSAAMPVAMRVFDAAGRVVRVEQIRVPAAGRWEFRVSMDRAASGVYLVVLESEGVRVTGRMAIVR